MLIDDTVTHLKVNFNMRRQKKLRVTYKKYSTTEFCKTTYAVQYGTLQNIVAVEYWIQQTSVLKLGKRYQWYWNKNPPSSSAYQ